MFYINSTIIVFYCGSTVIGDFYCTIFFSSKLQIGYAFNIIK
jgi:hypothetical protein